MANAGNGEGRHDERLPIKLILPKQGEEHVIRGGGTPPKPFRQVDRAFRTSLRNQVLAVQRVASEHAARTGVIPIRAKLLSKALAKSHRPESLFSAETCPIIGAGRLGELFLKATPLGLEKLAREIDGSSSDRLVKEISSVEVIEPVTPQFRTNRQTPIDVLRSSPRGPRGFVTRVRLFDFGGDEQRQIVGDFLAVCRSRQLPVAQAGYARNSHTYSVDCGSAEDVQALAHTIGVRSVSPMPVLTALRPRAMNVAPIPDSLTTTADVEGEFPVVVVVDTGVSSDIPSLTSWVVGSESFVSPESRNADHGTFVAGLVIWGAQLNPNLADIDSQPCGVFDVEVIPNTDPSRGDIEELTEQIFLQNLETALKTHANRFKVWNLSLGTSEVCSLDGFSALAEQLDNLQEKYQVSFVVSAGNYDAVPLLDYPRSEAQLAPGRITSPADSVLAVTVGSISHIDYPTRAPRQHHPSPFSRHGAGPNYIIKPDLVHYGGTCSTDGQHQSGVRSVTRAGCADDLGTSFATPLVSRALAQIYHQITPTPSTVLARALLTHNARDPRSGGRVPDGEENFLGFGRPVLVPTCLECTPYSSTLVFEDVLRPGYYLEWDDFPYPPSLRRGYRHFGEIWMTVAFAPARGGHWGSEYCETHIDATFGVFYDRVNRGTGEITEEFRGLVPPEHKNKGELYESFQVRELRKWAPVRTYHGELGKNGKRGKRWRLMVRLLTRHGVEDQEAFRSQPFSLILTIADSKRTAPVYDEMAQIVRNRFQSENLTLRVAARLRART
jgi:serine protease AprX